MTRHIGDIRIDRVIEEEGPDFIASRLLPDATPAALDPHRHWLEPRFLDPATQKLVLTMQSYVLRTQEHTIEAVVKALGSDVGLPLDAGRAARREVVDARLTIYWRRERVRSIIAVPLLC